MTFRLPICSSAVLVLLALLPGTAAAATLAGRVQITGAKAGRSLEGVAVWLVPTQGKAPAPVPQTVQVLQKRKRFSPHVSVVGLGWTVDWPNLDPIFHNAFSNFSGQPFDTGLYPPGGTQRIRFQREGVVRVFCNIHSTMSAVIVVAPTPWFAATKADGRFTIAGVPPGEYTLKVWHERSTETVLASAELRVNVSGDGTLDAIVLAETGFVTPAPHKNKYGRDYPPEPPSKAGYEQAPNGGGQRP